MKRFISLVVCILLVMSMATTAFAAEGDTVSLIINGKASNHRYVAYQIFKGDVGGSVLSEPSWGDSLGDETGAEFLAALKADTWRIINSSNPNQEGTTMKADLDKVTDLNSLLVRMGAWGNDLDRIDYFAHFLMYGSKLTSDDAPHKRYLAADPIAEATELDDNIYEFYNLKPGYYLIVDEGKFDNDGNDLSVGENEFFSKFMIQLLDGVEAPTVTVKGSVPEVTKGVCETLDGNYVEAISNQIGKIHYYEFEGTVPKNISNFTYYRYIFKDPLATGLEFNRLEQVYILNNTGTKVEIYKAPAEGQTDPWHSTSYKLDHFGLEMENGKEVLTVGWNNLLAKYPNLRPSDKIYVRYSAKLTEDAVVGLGGTVNQVYLEFSNDPYDDSEYGHTPPNDARVYTFGLNINKVDGANRTPLSGAEFYLYHYHSEDNVDTPVYAKTILGEDGVYYIDEWVKDYKVKEDSNHKPILDVNGKPEFDLDTDGNKQLDTNPMYVPDATSMVSASGTGEIKIYGLKDKIVYYLVETKAPNQYELLDYNPSVQITSYRPASNTDHNIADITYSINSGAGTNTTGTGSGVDLAIAKITIGNNVGAVLPSTGGMGTTILYAAGGILVLAAIVLLITKKRMANAE